MTRRIVILGGGIAGWTAAALLARRLPRPDFAVTLATQRPGDDGDIDGFGPVLATLPAANDIHARLGIDANLLLRAASGSFSLGTVLSGWTGDGSAHFLPFGSTGAALDGVPFHQIVARRARDGRPVRASDYAIAAVAAQAGRFARPVDDPRSILSSYGYGLHLDADAYRAVLRATALALGAAAVTTGFAGVVRDEAGSIAALRLADGTQVTGELFIDASGADAVLARHTLGTPFVPATGLPEDWHQTSIERDAEAPAPFAVVRAGADGWDHEIPLVGGRMITRYRSVDPAVAGDWQRHANGRLDAAWRANVIAIGAAAGVIPPLHPIALDLVHRAIDRLIMLFPGARHADTEAGEYNRLTASEFDGAADFTAAAFVARGATASAALAHKMALFRHRGRLAMYDGEPFDEEDWAALFDAIGIRPTSADAMADRLSADAIDRHLARIREAVIAGVRQLPPHADYLRRCWAAAPTGAAA